MNRTCRRKCCLQPESPARYADSTDEAEKRRCLGTSGGNPSPVIGVKIRHGHLPVGASLLIRMHEETNISIAELRKLMGDRRKKYRLSDAQGKPQAGGSEPA